MVRMPLTTRRNAPSGDTASIASGSSGDIRLPLLALSQRGGAAAPEDGIQCAGVDLRNVLCRQGGGLLDWTQRLWLLDYGTVWLLAKSILLYFTISCGSVLLLQAWTAYGRHVK